MLNFSCDDSNTAETNMMKFHRMVNHNKEVYQTSEKGKTLSVMHKIYVAFPKVSVTVRDKWYNPVSIL